MNFVTKLAIAFTLLLLLITLTGATSLLFAVPVTGINVDATFASLDTLPSLDEFVHTVQNGDPAMLVGVYVSGLLALPVVQQPDDSPAFVSTLPEVFTQFRTASQFNSTGILAHNFLAGQYLFELEEDRVITLVYGDGTLEHYQVDDIESYQALSPNDVYSSFVDLEHPNDQMSSTDLFYRTYGQGDNLVLQTCIQQGNEPSWGRLFVIAHPVEAFTATTPIQPNVWGSAVPAPVN